MADGGTITITLDPGPQDEWLWADEFDGSAWLEAAAVRSPSQVSLGRKRSHSTLTGYVPFAQAESACRWFLGYSYVDHQDLKRVRPARHPKYPGMVCTEVVRCQPLEPSPTLETGTTDGADLSFGVHEWVEIELAFSGAEWDYTEDWEFTGERWAPGTEGADTWSERERWTTTTTRTFVDVVEFQAGEFLFNFPRTDARKWGGTAVPRPIVVRSEKAEVRVTHHEVPLAWVMASDGSTPKIDAAIGKIGAADESFMGYDGQCWLVENVEMSEPYADPVAASVFGDLGKMTDITYILKRWAPEPGYPDNPDRGWLLVLAVDGKGYPVVRAVTDQDDPNAGKPLFEAVDGGLANLWTHWSV